MTSWNVPRLARHRPARVCSRRQVGSDGEGRSTARVLSVPSHACMPKARDAGSRTRQRTVAAAHPPPSYEPSCPQPAGAAVAPKPKAPQPPFVTEPQTCPLPSSSGKQRPAVHAVPDGRHEQKQKRARSHEAEFVPKPLDLGNRQRLTVVRHGAARGASWQQLDRHIHVSGSVHIGQVLPRSLATARAAHSVGGVRAHGAIAPRGARTHEAESSVSRGVIPIHRAGDGASALQLYRGTGGPLRLVRGAAGARQGPVAGAPPTLTSVRSYGSVTKHAALLTLVWSVQRLPRSWLRRQLMLAALALVVLALLFIGVRRGITLKSSLTRPLQLGECWFRSLRERHKCVRLCQRFWSACALTQRPSRSRWSATELPSLLLRGRTSTTTTPEARVGGEAASRGFAPALVGAATPRVQQLLPTLPSRWPRAAKTRATAAGRSAPVPRLWTTSAAAHSPP